jgi:hypothetical protein
VEWGKPGEISLAEGKRTFWEWKFVEECESS